MAIATATPLSWRKITPLHRKLGARSLRFVYPAGANLPRVATPLTIAKEFTAGRDMDRFIGFCLSIAASPVPANFLMSDGFTGWQFSYYYPGAKGIFIMGNVETLPEQSDLTVSFDAAVTGTVYLALFNFEVVPCQLG